ncbi:hypothetical protein P4T70_24890 [Bacillus mobilis]|uniref:hypothetical protein n=1 Tax=Bacillus cereus group TaxID=86661 RepID=UPI001F56ADB3|nr:hypothetical protein [Bacillus mobilis]MED0951292.1 hypothetical protein [Bacillus mobilis]
MDKSKLALEGIIQVYQNGFLAEYKEDDKKEMRIVLLELILEITRVQNDFRYCSKKNCPCCPEVHIAKMVKQYNDQLKKIFNPYILSDVSPILILDYLDSFNLENSKEIS